MDSGLLLKEQRAAVASKALAQVCLAHQFLDREAVLMITHALVVSQLGRCNVRYMGLPFKNIQKLQLIQNATAQDVWGISQYLHAKPLFCELPWSPGGFWMQSRMLVITYKALYWWHRTRSFARQPAYDCFCLPYQNQQVGMLQVPSIRQCHLWSPGAAPSQLRHLLYGTASPKHPLYPPPCWPFTRH